MADSNAAQEVDLLNLPDDELPDYPPGEEPEDNTAASEDAADTTTEEEDVNNDDAEESNANEDEGESSEEDESGNGDSEQGSDTPGNEEGNEEESDPEQVGSETAEGTEAGQQQEVDPEASKEAAKPTQAKSKAKGKGTTKSTEQTVSPGTEDQLKKLFAPFKANGRDMQVGSVEDARTLMQMGANYNKKMNGLKPNLKLIKMLENEKLLDEEKLSFLIDLQKQDPAAIAKLIKDSGFDALNYDEENQTDYTPNTYTVNEKEVNLDMVLGDIEDTPSFKKTIDAISNKWDAASKQNALNDPNVIRTINEHMESGMYDQVMDIVYNEKALGRLTQMSDLEAYKHVGDTLQASGAFGQQTQQPTANEVTTPKAKAPADPKLKNRKKAASNTRSKPAAKQPAIDPLSLSDEDFNKLDPALM